MGCIRSPLVHGMFVAGCFLVAGIGLAAANADGLDGAIGKAVFERLWVPAPASTQHADGLGPLFLARSCAACHRDGRAAAFVPGRDGEVEEPGLLYRLGDAVGAPAFRFGRQLQTRAAAGVAPEGRQRVTWEHLADGRLRPNWDIVASADGEVEGLRISARRAPSLRGAGLLASVPDAAILASEDPYDANRDGVSGRASMVSSREGGEKRIGRLGWKAVEPDMRSQVTTALALDLGLSTQDRPDRWGDCTDAQPDCRSAPHGAEPGVPEVPETLLAPLVRYVSALPGPARPVAPAAEQRGERLFAGLGCAQCHAPLLQGAAGPVRAYTDLLLHDLGEGLDDGLAEGDAASAEWRTAPLWSVGETIAQGGGLLHDGRARSVDEAVRWHDGEGAASRHAYGQLDRRDKAALERFVRDIR